MKRTPHLQDGRDAYRQGAWQTAFDAFSSADQAEPLSALDLELAATSAYLLGRDDDYVAHLERAHQLHLEAGDVPRAVRCGFWIGHSLMFRGERARGAGWFARIERLLEGHEGDCVEHGYLRIPRWLEQMGRGDFEAGYATAVEAAEIGERCDDPDLVWLARDDQARALMRLGRVAEARRLINEALVTATSGALSPRVTGIVFCNTIAFCYAGHEMRQVQEWTDALTRWCEGQPQMVAHNGLCQVHIAQIALFRGDWNAALERAQRCVEHFSRGALNRLAIGEAFYCQGEAHRLRGHFRAAEDAYQLASQNGREPQPGLALLRLRQEKADVAAATIRRVMVETTAPLARARRLPAYVEIMLATGGFEPARAACVELDEICAGLGCEVLDATAAYCRGSVALAEGRASDALIELRRAQATWVELEALYELARTRTAIGLACRALGDEDSARLELQAARTVFQQLGTMVEIERMSLSPAEPEAVATHGLTGRELEVLGRVAAGKTNRDIATELFISEHTVARHLQNIFAKLNVSTRTEAAAFAFEHDLA